MVRINNIDADNQDVLMNVGIKGLKLADGYRAYGIAGKESLQTTVDFRDEDDFHSALDMIQNPSYSTAYIQGLNPEYIEYEGIYTIGRTSTQIEYDIYTLRFSATRGGHLWKEVIQFTQPFETAWDTIEESFTGTDLSIPIQTESDVTTDGYYWWANIGEWGYQNGYMELGTDNGVNAAFVRKTSGHALVVNAVEIEVDVCITEEEIDGGITWGGQNAVSPITTGYGYTWGWLTSATPANRRLRLLRLDGTSTEMLFEFYDEGLVKFGDGPPTEWRRLKVTHQGDRIDVYAGEKHYGTFFDDTYDGGQCGVFAASILTYFDNFRLEILRPEIISLPVGAQGVNQHVVGEVFSNEGKIQYVVGPEKEVTYDQRAARIGSDALVLDLPLNEGTGTPVDHSGYNQAITAVNSPVWVKGHNRWTQRGLYCTKADDQHLTIADSNALDVGVMTTVQWINFTAWDETGDFWFYYKDNIIGHKLENADGYWYTALTIDGVARTVNSGITLNLDTDYCLAFTFDGQTWNWYVDGVLQATSTTYQGRLDSSTGEIWIPHATASNRGDCILYDNQVYNRALTAERITSLSRGYGDHSGGECKVWDTNGYEFSDQDLLARWLMDEGRGSIIFDSSGNGHDSDSAGGPPTWSSSSHRPESRRSAEFSGTNQYYQIDDDPAFSFVDATGDTPFTWTAWVYPHAVSDDMIFSKHNLDQADNREYIFWIVGSDIYARLYDNDGDYRDCYTTGNPIVANRWYYVVVTYDGLTPSGMNIYINGSKITSGITKEDGGSGSYDGMVNGNAHFRIGTYSNAILADYDGLVAKAEVWKREMGETEIFTRFQLDPILHDRANWVRKRKPMSIKEFVGNLVAENGLTRVVFAPQDGGAIVPEVFTFTDGYWKQVGYLQFILASLDYQVYGTNFSDSIKQQSDIRLVEVTRDRVVVEITTEVRDDDPAEKSPIKYRVILRSGFNGVIWESVEPKIWDNYYLVHYMSNSGSSPGTSLMNQFHWVPGNPPEDAVVADASVARTSSDDNWGAYFGPNLGVVFCTFQNQALGGFFSQMDLTNDRLTTPYVYGDDALAPYYRGGVAFTPFDVDLLFRQADTDLSDVTANGGTNDYTAQAGYTGDGAYRLYDTGHWVQWEIGVLPKGEYMLFVRLLGDNGGTEDGWIRVDNDGDQDGDLGQVYFRNIPMTWEYYGAIAFHSNGIDTIYTSVEYDDVVATLVDYWLLFPVSNKLNWPLDNAQQAMRQLNLRRISA